MKLRDSKMRVYATYFVMKQTADELVSDDILFVIKRAVAEYKGSEIVNSEK